MAESCERVIVSIAITFHGMGQTSAGSAVNANNTSLCLTVLVKCDPYLSAQMLIQC